MLKVKQLGLPPLMAAVALGAYVLLAWAQGQPSERPEPRAQRFLLIVCDSLRADHLGCYGSAKGLTPHVDQFARRAMRFEHAYAAAPWTVPSNVALATGKYPHTTRVRECGEHWSRGTATMAKYFRTAGFATAAFSASPLVSPQFGFAPGFDSFTCERDDDEAVVAGALEWMRAHRDESFFVLLYLLDPHWPYDPEPSAAHLRPARADVRDKVANGNLPLDPGVRAPRIVEDPTANNEVSMQEVEHLHALYEGDIASVDERIGRVLDAVADVPQLAVAITADHGEEWLEHGGLSHLFTLYDELLHIPLILSVPGEAPQTVSAPVTSVDILPTFLALAGVPPLEELPGVSLVGTEESDDRVIFAETPGWAPYGVVRFAARRGSQVLIWTLQGLGERSHRPPQRRLEFYDVARDPRQQRALAISAPTAEPLLGVLDESNPFGRATLARGDGPQLTSQMLEAMRAIGYVAD